MSMSVNPSLSSRRTAKAASPQVYFCGVLPTETYNLVGLRQENLEWILSVRGFLFLSYRGGFEPERA